MFTRSELEIKTIAELRTLCQRYGIKPTGNSGYKVSYITSLMAFPQLALQQINEGRGLKIPSFGSIQCLTIAIDEMGTPTNEQIALIRILLEGRRMNYPDRFQQEQLLSTYTAKVRLEDALGILTR
ncbi:hypothetical protein [Fortiea contorta]|uniref:hypothetical protein n=1 Tax=Fortiea contorta TaxID=1892405 RepID=UPI00034C9C1A|nr:hypothetical protein [Fortiea contorta]